MSKDVWILVSLGIVAAITAVAVGALSWGITNHAVGLGFWVGSLLTLGIFSYLYNDNAFYKFSEHLFVGVSASYWIATYYWTQIDTNLWGRLFPAQFPHAGHEQNLFYVIPLLLGFFMLARMIPSIGWLSRWSLAFIVGLYAGLRLYGFLQSNIMEQTRDTLRPLIVPGSLVDSINNTLIVVGVVCALLYFFFSREHTGAFGVASRVGIFFLMISFGASFGFAVMGRISLLIGRFNYLIQASDGGTGYASVVVTAGVVLLLGIGALRGQGDTQEA